MHDSLRLRRFLLPCLVCVLTALNVACESDSSEVETSNVQPTGSCVATPVSSSVASIFVPGWGTWPVFVDAGAGGAGGATGLGSEAATDGRGCDWNPDVPSLSVSCSGTADLEQGNDGGSLVATFEDGSVATIFVSDVAIPASGQIELSIAQGTTKSAWQPDRGYGSNVAKDPETGKYLWFFSNNMSNETLGSLLGVTVETDGGCVEAYEDTCLGRGTRQTFDHVVKTVPEQRIDAGVTARVTAPDGSYDVTWFSGVITFEQSQSKCADYFSPVVPTRFGMVRRGD